MLFELLVFFKFLLFFDDQIVFQWWQVRPYFHLNLLLRHVFEFFILVIQWKPFRIVHVPKFVVLPPVVLLLTLFSFSIISFNILLKSFVFSQTGIEPILYVIVDSSRHVLLDLDPLVAVQLMELHQLEVFSNSPLVFVQVRVYVVVPPFSALFTNSTRQVGCNFLPFLEPIFSHFVLKDHVFFRSPVTLDLLHGTVFSIVSEKQPPIHAVHFTFVGTQCKLVLLAFEGVHVSVELLCDNADVVNFMARHQSDQFIIL